MKDIHRLLVEQDPVLEEPALSAEVVRVMRREILRARIERPVVRWGVALTAAWAVAVAGVVTMTVRWSMNAPPGRVESSAGMVPPPELGGEIRQLQFAAPAGTRVIWIFNSDFHDEGMR